MVSCTALTEKSVTAQAAVLPQAPRARMHMHEIAKIIKMLFVPPGDEAERQRVRERIAGVLVGVTRRLLARQQQGCDKQDYVHTTACPT
jgi:hypothetical protein